MFLARHTRTSAWCTYVRTLDECQIHIRFRTYVRSHVRTCVCASVHAHVSAHRQVEYPVKLLRDLLTWRRGLSAEQESNLRRATKGVYSSSRRTGAYVRSFVRTYAPRYVRALASARIGAGTRLRRSQACACVRTFARPYVHEACVPMGRCLRPTVWPKLWDPDRALSNVVGDVLMPGGRRVQVRCTRPFEWALFQEHWAQEALSPEPARALVVLFDQIVPHGSDLLGRQFPPRLLLEHAGFEAHHAFVVGVILISKWLGEDLFPRGVYSWPPPVPDNLVVALD